MNREPCILMVFEGEDTEKKIFDNLKQYFLLENKKRIIYGFHCSEIYSLYNKLQKYDETLFFILKETLIGRNPELQNIEEIDVESIYLFFDYDGHAPSADYVKLKKMLELFNNEFGNGKLFISYPMVEAIKHLKKDIDFEDTMATSERGYKKVVSENCENNLLDLTSLTKENWNYIIDEHCKKANYIMNNDFLFPEKVINQIPILEQQKEKYININNQVAVLSTFPMMLLDYYGIKRLKEKITPESV